MYIIIMLLHTCEILLLSVYMTAIAQWSTQPQAVKSQKHSHVYHATTMAYLARVHQHSIVDKINAK